MARDDIDVRLERLEGTVRRNSEDIEGQGTTLEHLLNTVDSLVVPTIRAHTEQLDEHSKSNREAHDYIVSQKGAWSFIQKFGIVIAACASVVTMVMKLAGK